MDVAWYFFFIQLGVFVCLRGQTQTERKSFKCKTVADKYCCNPILLILRAEKKPKIHKKYLAT